MLTTRDGTLCPDNHELTVATICNAQYVWGGLLLIASLRANKLRVPVHVMTVGLSPAERRFFEQFDNVRTFEASPSQIRCAHRLKPDILLTAQTEYVGWFDSDTIVTGDITAKLVPPNGAFQCRFRDPRELVEMYQGAHAPGESRLSIPASVLDVWRRDVGGQQECAIRTTCTTDNFVLHRRYFSFLERWRAQMNKVLPNDTYGVTNRKSIAYYSTDESVLNSLLAFDPQAPPSHGEYLLDQDPNAMVAHFVCSPKPWHRWLKRHLKHFDDVVRLVEWLESQGLELPPTPWALQRRHKLLIDSVAEVDDLARRVKAFCRKLAAWHKQSAQWRHDSLAIAIQAQEKNP